MLKGATTVFVITTFVFSIVLPYVVHADVNETDPGKGGFQIVPCGVDDNNDGVVNGEEECNFTHLVAGTQRLINFLIYIAVFIAAIVFTWGGILYVTAAGDEAKIKKAHSMFLSAAVGFIIALSAWLIVNAIVSVFLKDGFSLLNSPN